MKNLLIAAMVAVSFGMASTEAEAGIFGRRCCKVRTCKVVRVNCCRPTPVRNAVCRVVNAVRRPVCATGTCTVVAAPDAPAAAPAVSVDVHVETKPAAPQKLAVPPKPDAPSQN